MNTRQELLACVRNLPLESGKTLPPDLWKNLRVYWRGPVLAHPLETGDNAIHEPPADSDLCLRYIARQKLLELTPDNGPFMASLNAKLAGDRQYPAISERCGAFANVLYGAIEAAISSYRTERAAHPQACLGNELWAIEVVGRHGQELQHVLYLWLVECRDDAKCRGAGGYRAWLVHEARHDLLASDLRQHPHRLPARGRRVEDFPLLPVMPIRGADPVLGDAFLGAF